nr:NifB/NifX family molybdenum-iron cluster-binding protein [Tissierella sp.]
MIVAIPVDKKSMDGNISEHFGRTEFFLILDLENDEVKFIDNKAINAQGGAGIIAAQTLVDNKIDKLISPRLGKNAFEVISGADITIYESNGTSIEENIKVLKEEKLAPLNDIHEGFHGNGGK